MTRYGTLAASTRVRFAQFIGLFEADGKGQLSFELAPLLENHCLQRYYDQGTRSRGYLLRRYLARLSLLLRSANYDLIWVEKELFPALPAFAERILRAMGVPVIVDYDDAAYSWYRDNPHWLVRALLGGKIDAVCRAADTVVVGNDTLAAYARAAGAQKVVVVPSVIEPGKYFRPKPHERGEDRFVVGWIGTPSNVQYLDVFRSALTAMSRDEGFKFLTIGAPDNLFTDVIQEAHPWSEDTEAALLGNCDCTLAPLTDGSWERGKCGFKVIQGMAAGLPVIASPVGVIREIIRQGENGFLAETSEDCHKYLRALRNDPELRRRVGDNARQTVEALYSVSAVSGQLFNVFEDALGVTRAGPKSLGLDGEIGKLKLTIAAMRLGHIAASSEDDAESHTRSTSTRRPSAAKG